MDADGGFSQVIFNLGNEIREEFWKWHAEAMEDVFGLGIDRARPCRHGFGEAESALESRVGRCRYH